jgi:hypothetical protein
MFGQFWRGERKLWQAFWLLWAGVSILFAVLAGLFAHFAGVPASLADGQRALVVVLMTVSFNPWYLYCWVVVWRCAPNSGWRGWMLLVRVLVLLQVADISHALLTYAYQRLVA